MMQEKWRPPLVAYQELELAPWAMASQCVYDHPTLFSTLDIDSLVIETTRLFLTDTKLEY